MVKTHLDIFVCTTRERVLVLLVLNIQNNLSYGEFAKLSEYIRYIFLTIYSTLL